MIKKIFISSVLLGMSSLASADWHKIAGNDEVDIYLDPMRVTDISNNQLELWVKRVVLKPSNIKGAISQKGDYSLSLQQFDCNRKGSSLIQVISYNSSGKVLFNYISPPYSNQFMRVIPDSPMETVVNFSCNHADSLRSLENSKQDQLERIAKAFTQKNY